MKDASTPASARPAAIFTAALAACYAVLWLGGVVAYLFLGGPPAHVAWTAPAFLALAAALVFAAAPAAEWPLLLAAAGLGFAAEAVGVATGFPFGRYHYTEVLFPHVLGVPVVMAAAWVVLFALVRQMAEPPWLAAGWMTAIDLVIDPLAVHRLNYWAWENGGPYYGIPWSNFAGWYAVSLALFLLSRRPAAPRPRAAWPGLSVVLFFAVIALGTGLRLAGAAGFGLVILGATRIWSAARQCSRSTPSIPPGSPVR